MFPKALSPTALCHLQKHTIFIPKNKPTVEIKSTPFSIFIDYEELSQSKTEIQPIIQQWIKTMFDVFQIALSDVEIYPLPSTKQISQEAVQQTTRGLLLFSNKQSIHFGSHLIEFKKPNQLLKGKRIGVAKFPVITDCFSTSNQRLHKEYLDLLEELMHYAARN